MKYTKDTFKYFEGAKKNKNNKAWFDKNKPLYEKGVKEPTRKLLIEIATKYQRALPRIEITPDKITRPVRPKNRVDENGLLKDHMHFTLWEKKTSLFEWNPAIHFQLGLGKDENFLGVGLYMVSSRQTSLLRNALVEDFDSIDAIMMDRKLKKSWGELKGDVYKRFPKGYDPESEAAKYLKYKQFYVSKNYTRAEVQSPKFIATVIKDLGETMEFFSWVRNTVGTYKR